MNSKVEKVISEVCVCGDWRWGAVSLLWAFLLLREVRAQQNGPQARSKEEEKRVPQTPLREHPNNPRASH